MQARHADSEQHQRRGGADSRAGSQEHALHALGMAPPLQAKANATLALG